jgi:hypothetical protein
LFISLIISQLGYFVWILKGSFRENVNQKG